MDAEPTNPAPNGNGSELPRYNETKDKSEEAATLDSDTGLPDSPLKDTTNSTVKDLQDIEVSISTKVPRRVKVYLLQGEDWLDNGTGYCTGEMLSGENKPYFIVRNELNPEEIILKSFLEGSIQYQRQQETLIVWTDLLGKDLALSFQETEGCAEVCEFIIEVQQQNYCPEISLYYVIPNNGVNDGNTLQNGTTNDITELITGPITYPKDPTIDNLDVVIEAINQGSNSQYTRSNILKFAVKEEYFMKLVDVFDQLESSHNLKNLFKLTDIIKALILYNEPCLIGDFLSTETKIMGLVGILEYDSEYPNFKACHRDFLKDKSKFKSVIDIPNLVEGTDTENNDNLTIFKKDFFLNFLKNVALARFLDDQTYNTISSLIYFNQVEIINFLKDSKKNDNFCEKLFCLYNDEVTPFDDDTTTDLSKVKPSSEIKRDGVRMLHQYVLITKSLQSYQKSEFFSVLVNTGLFKMIGFALKDDDINIRVLGTELIAVIIDQDVSLVNSVDCEPPTNNAKPPLESKLEKNQFELKTNPDEKDQGPKLTLSDDMTLTLILSKLLLEDKNPGLKIQAFGALRILLDSNIANNITLPDDLRQENSKKSDFELEWLKNEANNDDFDDENPHDFADDVNHINTHNYFKAFYGQVASTIFHNLIQLAKDLSEAEQENLITDIKNDQILYQHLCELISFCCKEHETQLSQPFFLDNHILLGVGRLITSDVKMMLKLSAIRCLKHVVLLNDSAYTRYMIDHDILKYFLNFFEIVLDQNNLANSTCLDFLEMIIKNCDKSMNHGKRLNFKLLATYIYDNYRDLCNRISYVSTGKDLVNLVENKFYDNSGHTAKQMSIYNDSTFDSDDDELLNGSHNVSTPIASDGEEDVEETVKDNGVSMFENVQKEMTSVRGGKEEREVEEVEKLQTDAEVLKADNFTDGVAPEEVLAPEEVISEEVIPEKAIGEEIIAQEKNSSGTNLVGLSSDGVSTMAEEQSSHSQDTASTTASTAYIDGVLADNEVGSVPQKRTSISDSESSHKKMTLLPAE